MGNHILQEELNAWKFVNQSELIIENFEGSKR